MVGPTIALTTHTIVCPALALTASPVTAAASSDSSQQIVAAISLWALLGAIRWFQVVTLFNPLTYASEGMRYAMLPPSNGQSPKMLAIGWVLLMLCASFALFLGIGLRLFRRWELRRLSADTRR